ncbi:MAG: aminopeptidase P family protein [Candidatus Aenigmatarchaeota archaeon]|nr:MAG: aminopeptidase P family protein [Candidatus Aenigmarchaeota archaeon]
MHSELKLRLKKLRAAGAFERVDAIVLYNPEFDMIDPNATYMTNVRADGALVVVYPSSVTLYTSDMSAPLTHGSWAKVEKAESFREVVRGIGGTVGLNGAFMSYASARRFRKKTDVSPFFAKARAVKTPYEIRTIRASVREARRVLASVRIVRGRTESDVASDIIRETLSRGLQVAFHPIVATGRNTSSPHHTPTRIPIKHFCYVDYGVRYKHYCSDLTVPIGIAEGVREVKGVLDALEEYIKPGVPAAELHNTALKLLGFRGKYLIHALGHGIGLEVHEAPRIGPNSKGVLEEGMVVAIEPAFYMKTRGVRIENNYLVTRNGCKRL